MAGFRILQTDDPVRYREQIVRFWDEYLPGTPHGRFEWMKHRNPAGPALWLLALKADSDELIGTISIMPRKVFLNGQMLRTGIVGDFMVHEKHRVFGPTMQLPKAVVERFSDLGFDFLYTIPNQEGLKVIRRNGFKYLKRLCCYVKPIKVQSYLEKYLPPPGAKLLGWVAEIPLRFLSRETYISLKGFFREASEMDESFDVLSEKIKKRFNGLAGDRSSANLKWRYLENPLYQFHVMTYRKKEDAPLSGYVIFGIHDDEMDLFDIISLERSDTYPMLKKIIEIGRARDCKGIYFTTSHTDARLNIFKSYGFFDAREEIQVFHLGGPRDALENWDFLNGDRNI